MPAERIVLHLDMDAFFAAVEQRDRAELRGQPVIVGYPGRRGVVSTCSYEARRFGVRSAMPSVRAAELCPQGVWVKPRHGHYSAVSKLIFAIVEARVPVVEKVSVDEAYGDLSGWARDFAAANRLAQQLKQEIVATEQLTASIGIAPNRFLAKLASDMEKPDGLVTITAADAASRIAPLSVRAIPGIGPKLEARLRLFEIRKIGDLLLPAPRGLEQELGAETLAWLQARARGEDESEIGRGGERKQISEERTYLRDLVDPREIERELLARVEAVAEQLRGAELLARTVVLKVRDDRFVTITRSSTLSAPSDVTIELHRAALELWRSKVDLKRRGLRLLGFAVKEFVPRKERAPELFPDPLREKARAADRAADQLRSKFGSAAVQPARLLDRPKKKPSR